MFKNIINATSVKTVFNFHKDYTDSIGRAVIALLLVGQCTCSHNLILKYKNGRQIQEKKRNLPCVFSQVISMHFSKIRFLL